MRTFFVILAICVAGTCASTLKDEQKVLLKSKSDECIAATGVDAKVIDDIRKGGEIQHTEKFDCYGSCLLKKFGLQREDGSINIKDAHDFALKTNVDIQKADKVIEECAHYVGKNACDTAGHVLSCFLRNKSFPVLD